jgi:carboxymethylenebutenolidase
MTRMTAKDFSPALLELYDFYAHGKITRREFLDRAGKYTAAGVTAVAALDMLKPDYALAQQVSFTDPDIVAEYVTYPSPEGHGEVRGYLVKPASQGPHPAVVVVHENRGLNPYIEDVARRLGKAGFMALAPDGLTSVGGYPGNDDRGRELQAQVDSEKLLNDFFAAFEHLLGHDDSTGKVGCVGFCYGGGVCNAMAVAYPELAASVPFYGRQADAADVPRIEAPLLLHYAGTGRADQRRLARLRGRARGARQGLHGAFLRRRQPRLPQRLHAALRRGGRRTRLGAHHRLLQRASDVDPEEGRRPVSKGLLEVCCWKLLTQGFPAFTSRRAIGLLIWTPPPPRASCPALRGRGR